MAMKLDHEDLNRLIEKISSSDIQEFSLEGEDFKLEIKRNLSNQNQPLMDEQLRIILIIIVSVSIFGLLVFVFVKNYVRQKIDNLVEEEKDNKTKVD